MREKHSIALYAFAALIVALLCGSCKADKNTTASMALPLNIQVQGSGPASGDIIAVTGPWEIRDSSNNVVASGVLDNSSRDDLAINLTLPVNATDLTLSFGSLTCWGDTDGTSGAPYTWESLASIVDPDYANYDSCVFAGTTPATFSTSQGEISSIVISLDLLFEGGATLTASSVSIAEISLDNSFVENVEQSCETNEVYLDLGDGPTCYALCENMGAPCGTSGTCLLIADGTIVSLGEEIDPNDPSVIFACVGDSTSSTGGAGGVSGSAGAGGIPSSAGAGGASSTAGAGGIPVSAGAGGTGGAGGTTGLAQDPMPTDANFVLLHHSVGGLVWDGGVPSHIQTYNALHQTSYQANDILFPAPGTAYRQEPGDTDGWTNAPFDYWNIWVNHAGSSPYQTEPTLEILVPQYDLISFKFCFDSLPFVADTGTPDITSYEQRLENFYPQLEAVYDKMLEFQETRFLMWTMAPLRDRPGNDVTAARMAALHTWMKNVLDIPGDNVFVFDYESLATNGSGDFLPEAWSANPSDANGDPHPSNAFGDYASRLLTRRIAAVLNGTADTCSVTGEDCADTPPLIPPPAL